MRARTKPKPSAFDDVPSNAVFGSNGMSVAAFVNSVQPKTSRGSGRMTELEIAIRSAAARAESGEWHGVTGAILVGLYARFHQRVYGVAPLELDSRDEMKRAAASAGRMLRDSFAGDGDEAVEFMKWAWKRERSRAEYAKQKGFDRNRMGWRMQFSTSLLTDYRMDQHNQRVRTRR